MKRDVFGDFVVTAKDYSEAIVNELSLVNYIKIQPNYATKKGVITEHVLDSNGFYFVFKLKSLAYIGYSNHSIHDRIGRFFAGVRGTERDDESHPAAYKYKKYFGTNCENLTLKIVPVSNKSLLSDVSMEDIEECLIRKLRPALNIEVYRNRDIISHEMRLETKLS